MAEHLCPWWVGYLLISPIRSWLQNPEEALRPHVKAGMQVADIGCAMGFFSLPMGRLVGEGGKVYCIDMQERMIKTLNRRIQKAGLKKVIETRTCEKADLGLDDLEGKLDLALAFYVLHEVKELPRFLQQTKRTLRPGGRFLVAEPKGHVTKKEFGEEIKLLEQEGFKVVDRPVVSKSHTVLCEV